MKKERLEVAIKNLHRANINTLQLKKSIKRLNAAATAFDFTKKLRGKMLLKQKRTIAELNEENDNLVIEMAQLKSDHDKHVDKILGKGMPELVAEVNEYLSQQKGRDSLIEHRNNKEDTKEVGIAMFLIDEDGGLSLSEYNELRLFLKSIEGASVHHDEDNDVVVHCKKSQIFKIKENIYNINSSCRIYDLN